MDNGKIRMSYIHDLHAGCTKPCQPDCRGWNEREIIALDLCDYGPGLVCLSIWCMESDDCPHMATAQCDPRGLNTN